MRLVPRALRVRPRLFLALAAMAGLALALPSGWSWTTRLLIAWDAGAVLYLAMLAATLLNETVPQIRARAARQDEGGAAILVIACLAATASIAAIGLQLAGIGGLPPGERDPDYVDFLYFAYTIGCTSQTSDVAVTTRAARGLVLVHSILAFVFNTSILALAINVGASLVSAGS